MRQNAELCGNGLKDFADNNLNLMKMAKSPPISRSFHKTNVLQTHKRTRAWKYDGKRRKCWKLALPSFPVTFSTLGRTKFPKIFSVPLFLNLLSKDALISFDPKFWWFGIEMWPINRKGTLWELRKVLILCSLHSPRRLTVFETFRYWQIFCELSHYQTTNFRLFQTERVCRRRFLIWQKWKKVIQTGRKHCGKRLVFQRRQKVSLCGNGLSDSSTYLICHFEIIELYRPVLSSSLFLLFYLRVLIMSLLA